MKILIVDDNPDILCILHTLLEGHGHAVEDACHGAEALAKARLAPPQLIVSDLLMPVMDGYTLLRHWKSDEALKTIPFIVYSATYTAPEDEKLARDLGADAYILKPAEPEQFMAHIADVLAKKERGELPPPKQSAGGERVHLKEYSEVLVRKLEAKALQAEQAHRALERDIAERRRMEVALRENEERLRLALDAARMGQWEWNIVTGEIAWSAQCLAIYGLPSGTHMTYERFLQALHPEDRGQVEEALHRAVANHAAYDEEKRVIWPDGSVHWTASRGKVYCDASGQPVRMTGVTFDITERKQAEVALRATEARYRALFEHAPDGILIADPKSSYLDANASICRMLGYTRDELIGLDASDIVAREEISNIQPALNAIKATSTYHREWKLKRKDGSVFKAEVSATMIPDGNLLGMIRDITDRKQAEENLRKAKHAAEAAKFEAERANRAKDHFLAVLSHELRTPLAAVLPALEILNTRLSGDDLKLAEMVRRNVELEARLIDDLLDITRVARGKVELNLQPVDLRHELERAIEICRPSLDAGALRFSVECGARPLTVEGDPVRLQQVFWNLLQNAIKFTPPGGRVALEARASGDLAVIQITDSGCGIEPEKMPALFSAFSQGGRSTTRQFGGLGLGLAISKALVELHGGAISAASAGHSRGATFTVELPLLSGVECGERSDLQAAPQAAARSAALRILLVEDHEDTAFILVQGLMKAGHAVTHACDVATALEMTGSAPFDLLISDLGLPDGTGQDLMRTLRQNGNTMKGIAFSGYGMPADIEQSRESGFAEHIIKPVELKKLVSLIRQVTGE